MFAFGQKTFVPLADRGVIRVGGPDARPFLQGLVSNDVNRAVAGRVIYAALLTPQGKYLHDFFIVALPDEQGESLHLDCEGQRTADLVKRLNAYKLRSRVTIEDVTDRYRVIALLGDGPHDSEALCGFEGRGGPFAGGMCYVDPRYAGVGARALLPVAGIGELMEAGFEEKDPSAYERLRLYYGLPDGSRDLPVEKALLLESGFDDLHGIDWNKGCYVGQELTARTRYRSLVRKLLLPVQFDGEAPPYGAAVTAGGEDIGEMRTSFDGHGIALFRVELLDKAVAASTPITSGGAAINVLHPGWLKHNPGDEPAESPPGQGA
ncbi:MAG TPA: folate-binding protein [Alphaproteobacteria bacterium]|jgi:folate-binding protein YgfZ|nr:folate-binding protein [Alphaproteobacteria bacterium]